MHICDPENPNGLHAIVGKYQIVLERHHRRIEVYHGYPHIYIDMFGMVGIGANGSVAAYASKIYVLLEYVRKSACWIKPARTL